MKNLIFTAAVLALAACGQASAPPEAPAAPASLMQEAQALSAENQPVFAYQQLTAYQRAHPEALPACAGVRRVDALGYIPDDVAEDSLYAPHKGAMAFTVQCGAQLTTVRDDPREHWLVALTAGAPEATVINCANPAGDDQCPRIMPRAAATP